jgi:predicted MFS family arabinose efflux permease
MFTSSSNLEDNSSWYRAYVLLVLLVVSIHNLCTRNLPSYLVTVQVPGCEDVCAGVSQQPLCGSDKWSSYEVRSQTDACQVCRASGGSEPKDLAKYSLPQSSLNFIAGSVTVSEATSEALALQAEALTLSRLKRDGNFYNMADGACIHNLDYGWLIGYGFALVFGCSSVPAAWLCDRRSRVELAAIACLAWSAATFMQATAHGFWALLAQRSVLGAAQALAMPAAMSIGFDVFATSRERQSLVMAMLSIGFYLGSGCASFSIWFAVLLGWRWAVLIAGLVGMVLAGVLYFTVKEPERTEFSAPCSLSGVREEVFIKSRVARWCLLAATAKMLSAYVLGTYLPLYYSRANLSGYSNIAYAGFNALIVAFGGLVSTLSGSALAEYWSARDNKAPCWIGAIGAALSIPLLVVVICVSNFFVSMVCWLALLLVSEAWFAPTILLVQRSLRQSHRRQAIPLFLVAVTLGANVGPAVVSLLDPGNSNVGGTIIFVCVAANVVAAVGFLFTAREIALDPIAAGVSEAFGDEDFPKSKAGSGVMHWLSPF